MYALENSHLSVHTRTTRRGGAGTTRGKIFVCGRRLLRGRMAYVNDKTLAKDIERVCMMMGKGQLRVLDDSRALSVDAVRALAGGAPTGLTFSPQDSPAGETSSAVDDPPPPAAKVSVSPPTPPAAAAAAAAAAKVVGKKVGGKKVGGKK